MELKLSENMETRYTCYNVNIINNVRFKTHVSFQIGENITSELAETHTMYTDGKSILLLQRPV